MTKLQRGTILENILVNDAASEGNGVARYNDLVIFIKGAIPGDIVDISILNQKKNFAEANIHILRTPSEIRTTPFCEHFGTCGGCKWQHMEYPAQVKFKADQVKNALERIGKIPLPMQETALGATENRHYRNKLEYTFSNKRWLTTQEIENQPDSMNALGFHVPKRFDKILHIDKCYLQDDLSNEVRNFLFAYSEKHNFTFYDAKQHTGFLRNLVVRNSTLNQWMITLVFAENNETDIINTMEALKSEFPSVSTWLYVVNEKKNDTLFDQHFNVFHGNGFIEEQLENIKYRISPKSFFQTNSVQALALYQKVRDYAGLTGTELVYDLYTGTGSIALFVAKHAAHVVGIEYVEDAIKDAQVNADLNGIRNTSFFAGDMKKMLDANFVATHGMPDVVITDPPRAGMDEPVVKALLQMMPNKIVYVSCNAATQARDLELMKEVYTVTRYCPVDMFPHSHHVENIVLLEKKN